MLPFSNSLYVGWGKEKKSKLGQICETTNKQTEISFFFFLKLTKGRNGKDLIEMIEQGVPNPRGKKKFYCHKKMGGNGPD